MPGLAHDLPFFDVMLGRRRGKAVAQAVGAVVVGIHAHEPGIVLDDEGDRFIGNPGLTDMMPLRQSPEDRTCRDAADIEPFLQGRDGTEVLVFDHGDGNHLALVELVRLRFAQGNEQAQAGELQVFHVDAGQF